MNASEFLVLFSFLSTVTGLAMEAYKKLVPNDKWLNFSALMIGLLVGIVGTCIYYIFNNINASMINIASAVCMGFACGLGSMVGYDKIKQLIAQINGGK